jgi:hypothetical protein
MKDTPSATSHTLPSLHRFGVICVPFGAAYSLSGLRFGMGLSNPNDAQYLRNCGDARSAGIASLQRLPSATWAAAIFAFN